jgi:hypothetical protein
VRIAQLDTEVANSQYQGKFAAFESSLTTNYSNERSTPSLNSQDPEVLGFSIPVINVFRTSFSKNTTLGIRYGITLSAIDTQISNYTLDDDNQATAGTERETSVVSNALDVSIPLGQDFGSVNTVGVRRGFLNNQERQKDLLSETLTFLEGFVNVYWQLKQIYAMYEVQYEKTLLSERLYLDNKIRQESGAGDALQVVTSLNNYQSDTIALSNIWNSIVDINEQIKDVFDLLDLDLFLYPSDDFPVENLDEEVDYYLEKVTDFHPNFLALKIDKEKNKLSLLESENADRADIDFNIRYSQIGAGLDRSQATETLSVSELDGYKVELTWRLPFGNKTAKSKKGEVLYQGLKLDSRRSGIVSGSRLAIRKRLRDLKTRQEEMNITKENTEIIEQNFQRERIKYDNGSSTSLILQEIQTELVSSKFRFVTAQTNYAILYSKMFIDTGEIFEKYNIPIPLEK